MGLKRGVFMKNVGFWGFTVKNREFAGEMEVLGALRSKIEVSGVYG